MPIDIRISRDILDRLRAGEIVAEVAESGETFTAEDRASGKIRAVFYIVPSAPRVLLHAAVVFARDTLAILGAVTLAHILALYWGWL